MSRSGKSGDRKRAVTPDEAALWDHATRALSPVKAKPRVTEAAPATPSSSAPSEPATKKSPPKVTPRLRPDPPRPATLSSTCRLRPPPGRAVSPPARSRSKPASTCTACARPMPWRGCVPFCSMRMPAGSRPCWSSPARVARRSEGTTCRKRRVSQRRGVLRRSVPGLARCTRAARRRGRPYHGWHSPRRRRCPLRPAAPAPAAGRLIQAA